MDQQVNNIHKMYRIHKSKEIKELTHLNCRLCGRARFAVKVDDDISLDLTELENLLHSKYGGPGSKRPVPDTIECPSVMRNMRPWRQTHNKVK